MHPDDARTTARRMFGNAGAVQDLFHDTNRGFGSTTSHAMRDTPFAPCANHRASPRSLFSPSQSASVLRRRSSAS
jgi:hypothetical protein